jgi:small-conductance mechanosensitive channel
MLHAFFRFCLVALATFTLSLPLQAQDTSVNTDALAQAIEQAAESGVGVVIIDSSGRPVERAAEAAAEEAEEDPMEGASRMMRGQMKAAEFRQALSSRLEALPYSIFEVQYVLSQTSPDGTVATYVYLLALSVVLLMIGRWASIEFYGKRVAARLVVARVKQQPDGYREKMPFLVFRFLMGMLGTVFAMVFAMILGAIFGEMLIGHGDDSSVQFTLLAIYSAYFLSRTVSDLWRMVLSPFLSQYRIPRFSDRDAKRLYYWASALATYDIVAVMFATWVGDFGLNYNVYALVYGLTALVALAGNLLLILFNGAAISSAIRNGRPAKDCAVLVRILSYAWAPALMVYMIFGWLKLTFDLVLERDISIPLMAGTYMVLTSILVVYGVINYLIERYFDRSRQIRKMNEEAIDAAQSDEAVAQELMEQAAAQRHPIATYEDLARRVAGILAFVTGAYALIVVWNPDAAWLRSTAAERIIDVTVILFIGFIVYHLFRIWIDSKIDEETGGVQEPAPGDEGGATGASRLATLLPLFRGAILAVVVVSITLIVLMEVGVNVSPLFAGAGVVGLAVGFGSQTLVRDIFSGAFYLMDDAFRKGEYIDIGDVKGTVEKISVRSFQLRHHLGALHTIPFGEIKVLSNYSRDWVMMKLPLRVTYDTDVDKVRKLIKKLGQQMLSDPEIGDNFIQPLKSQGVIEMQDSAMIIRVKFMTKPGDQWTIRKKVFQEIRDLFDREGIKFAHREVTVRLAEDQADNMTPKQKDAAIGAVQAAIDEDLLDANEPAGGDDR